MKNLLRTRRTLAIACCAAALGLCGPATIVPASAATADATAPPSNADAPASTAHAAPAPGALERDLVVKVSATTSVAAAPRDSAGDPCDSATHQENGEDEEGVIVLWFRMQTSWCWDYRTVTSHATRLNWAVTVPGDLTGWGFAGHSGVLFNCYVADGSTRQCSGNREIANAWFDNPVTGQECTAFITEEENYKRDFFSGGYPCGGGKG